ncbi:MAG: PAS domain S-box protein [Proteobacteria bacterium]|nr:PAS domain S-box protein [Pseudomonadota bacterium]MBU1738997.1 PAS domain S-box protein [Pseudomonadota bacterium]
MKILNGLRLRWKLSLLIAFMMSTMGLITISVIDHRMEEALLEALTEKAASIAGNLAIDSVDPILVDNRILLHQLMLNVYSNESDISYIFIANPDNSILCHTFNNGFPSDLQSISHPGAGAKSLHQRFETEEGIVHDISIPILKGKAGYLHLGVNASRQDEKIAAMNRDLIQLAFMGALLGFLVAFLAGRMMGKPLSALADAVKLTGRGEISPALPVTGDDEIGILTDKFNRMSADLQTYLEERDEAETALKQSESLYRSLVENIDFGITYIDSDHTIIMANNGQGRMFGRDPESFIGKKCFNEFEKREHTCPHCPGATSMITGKPAQVEAEGIRKDGSRFSVLIRSFPVKDPDGKVTGFIEVVEDITERLQLEKEISKARQMESIGVLAGGIAHDFNNLLTAVFGNIELAKLFLKDPEAARERLVDAEGACAQAKNLTGQLLTFSKGGSPIREKTALADFLRETCLAFPFGAGIEFNLETPDSIREVMTDRQQLERVVTNILENSCEAMPSGGSITVAAANVSVAPASSLPLSPGNYVEIKFTDNGPGISPEIIGKIFDPYFTTKDMGSDKGTGLGLSICHSIIAKHKGHIRAGNHPAGGAEFTIYLPADESAKEAGTDAARKKQTGTSGKAPSDSLRILVLEDESVVIETLTRMLEHLGYEAEFAMEGEAAVRLCREATDSGTPFDLGIMDLAIQDGMGGLEAFRKILSFAPDFKAVVSSGYTDDPVMADYAAYGFKETLPKPFSIGKLEETIRKIR